jgi:hypothetical protein
MSLSGLCKGSVAVLVVLVGGLAAAAPAPLPKPAEAGRGKDRYHLYGWDYTRLGGVWTYLGAYASPTGAEDAQRVAQRVAVNRWGEPFQQFVTIRSDRLKLPPNQEERWCRYSVRSSPGNNHGRALPPSTSCRTAEEAVAAAEAILARGERFEVTYRFVR